MSRREVEGRRPIGCGPKTVRPLTRQQYGEPLMPGIDRHHQGSPTILAGRLDVCASADKSEGETGMTAPRRLQQDRVAIREAQPLGRPMQPLTLCAYEVDAVPVFDAIDEERRRALSVLDSYLDCPAWEAEMLAGGIPASQALADRLIAARYVGMRVRSFAAGAGVDDLNLVMWKWGPERPARVVLIDDENRLSGGPAH